MRGERARASGSGGGVHFSSSIVPVLSSSFVWLLGISENVKDSHSDGSSQVQFSPQCTQLHAKRCGCCLEGTSLYSKHGSLWGLASGVVCRQQCNPGRKYGFTRATVMCGTADAAIQLLRCAATSG